MFCYTGIQMEWVFLTPSLCYMECWDVLLFSTQQYWPCFPSFLSRCSLPRFKYTAIRLGRKEKHRGGNTLTLRQYDRTCITFWDTRTHFQCQAQLGLSFCALNVSYSCDCEESDLWTQEGTLLWQGLNKRVMKKNNHRY